MEVSNIIAIYLTPSDRGQIVFSTALFYLQGFLYRVLASLVKIAAEYSWPPFVSYKRQSIYSLAK